MYSILEFSPHWGKHAFFSKTEIAIRCRILSATKLRFYLNLFFANANPIPSFTWNSWEKIFGAMASFGNNLVENTENGES